MALDPRIGPENPTAGTWIAPPYPPGSTPVMPLALAAYSASLQPLNVDTSGRLIVTTVASGAGSDGTVTINALASGVIGTVAIQAGTSGVIGTVTIQATTLASGQAFGAMQPSPAMRFNGATVDLERGNVELPQSLITLATVLAGTSSSPDQTNFNGRGVVVYPNVSFVSGNPTITFLVMGKDPISATYYSIIGSPAITTTGMFPLIVYPGGSAVANHQAAELLPRTWIVRSIVAGGSANSAVSATVGACMIV